jgi:ferredoxin
MSIKATCPACGFESPEIRCPRCNALKVQGCSGACSACASSCKTGKVPMAPDAPRPSEEAAVDDEHPGTPLSR